jgi:flagellar motor switch/type III secretory pathway protein FliN
MTSVQDWLPAEAFASEAVRVAKRTAQIASTRAIAGAAGTVLAQCTQVRGKHASVLLTPRGKRLLLEAILDIDLAQLVLTEGDRHVLDALAGDAIDDLVAQFDEVFAANDGTPGAPQIAAALMFGSSDLLTLSLPEHLLVPLIKARIGPSACHVAPLRQRMSALTKSSIVVEGVLGRAELALSDLKEIGVGDVLVLDRSLKDPVELRMPGEAKPLAHGRLCRNGDRISIQL